MHKLYLTRPDEATDDESTHEIDINIADVQDRFGKIYKQMQTIEDKNRTSNVSEEQVQRYHYIANISDEINSMYLRLETERNRTLENGAGQYLSALKWHYDRLFDGSHEGPYESYPRDCREEINWYTTGLQDYYRSMAQIATHDEAGDPRTDPLSGISWELTKLFALNRLGNFYPLLLALWDDYRTGAVVDSKLHEALQMMEIAAFRIYAVQGKAADTGRSKLYSLANGYAHEDYGIPRVLQELKEAVKDYEDDEMAFENALRNKSIYKSWTNRDLRYLLYSYDLHIEGDLGGARPGLMKAVKNTNRDYSLDHIWPQEKKRLELTPEQTETHDEWCDSLGNLTLATGRRNASWRDDPYAKKQTEYQDSPFAETRSIASRFSDWGDEPLQMRIDEIVSYAEERWSLDDSIRREEAARRP